MSEEVFNLVFSGELVKGSQEDAVKANLMRLFKFKPEQVDKMFSGKVITIKKNIDADTGRKLRAKFKQAGALCRLESFSITSVSPEPSPIDGANQVESKSEVPADTSSSVSSPAVFAIPDDPVEEEPVAESDSTSAETEDSSKNQPNANSSPAVFAIPDDPVEEEPEAESDSASAEAEAEDGSEDQKDAASSPAVFAISDDPVEEEPEAESDSASVEAEDSSENQKDAASSPAVFAIPDDPVEEEPEAESDSVSAETNEDVEAKLIEEPEQTSETELNINNDQHVSEISDPLVDAVEEVEDSSSIENKETSSDGLTIAPPGVDVLEGYYSPEPPPPPNVDGMTIAPPGTDLLEVKKVVKPVEVDISGISLVKEDA